MKLSLKWIGDYVTLPAGLAPRELAHQLTMATVEVEGVHETPDGDVILEIDNKSLTNRPDLWGHYGVARELAAIFNVPLRALPFEEPPLPKAALIGTIDPAACRRFTATLIEGVTVLETPQWMADRLMAIGQRSKNLYADLTNYVMMTVGQPTHAFNADALSLPLSVRMAADGEPFNALDGSTHALSPVNGVVADTRGPVALAGVIGGLESSIQAGTSRVLFEAATFDALSVRRTAAMRGLRTEASTRYEKNLSTHRIDEARRLFFHLLKTIDPGARVVGFDDRVNVATAGSEVRASAAYLRGRIGRDLSIDELRAPLERLGFGVTIEGGAGQETVVARVPEWRSTGDVSGPHDLVEEIARLHGYERFEFQAPEIRVARPARNYKLSAERRVKEYLAFGCGLQEVINYPWVEDRFVAAAGLDPAAAPFRLGAPPAPDQATLRTSLVPGLLRAIESNIRWRDEFGIFESGAVFPAGDRAALDDQRERLPGQPKRIAAAFVGSDPESLFRAAKGALESLGARAHVRAIVTRAAGTAAPWADIAAHAAIVPADGPITDQTDQTDQAIGSVGILNRRGTRAAGLKHAFAAIFELDLAALESSPSRSNVYTALPELPSVEVDVSLMYADSVTWARIAETAKAVSPLIAGIDFIDQYRGKGIPEGHRSITLRARLQPTERTLTTEEAAGIADAIRAAARATLGATER
jgi:phenylalanyl-tRNA synthetase beta chain